MGDAEEKSSVDEAAVGASLPGAGAHLLSRLFFRWVLLPAAIIVPVGGAAGVAWRLAHMRARAEDVEAAQAIVEQATDEAEAEVDESQRSDLDQDVEAAALARRRGVPARDLAGLANMLAALQQVPQPSPEERMLRQAEKARQRAEEKAKRRALMNAGLIARDSEGRQVME
jgi:hypothetical protein